MRDSEGEENSPRDWEGGSNHNKHTGTSGGRLSPVTVEDGDRQEGGSDEHTPDDALSGSDDMGDANVGSMEAKGRKEKDDDKKGAARRGRARSRLRRQQARDHREEGSSSPSPVGKASREEGITSPSPAASENKEEGSNPSLVPTTNTLTGKAKKGKAARRRSRKRARGRREEGAENPSPASRACREEGTKSPSPASNESKEEGNNPSLAPTPSTHAGKTGKGKPKTTKKERAAMGQKSMAELFKSVPASKKAEEASNTNKGPGEKGGNSNTRKTRARRGASLSPPSQQTRRSRSRSNTTTDDSNKDEQQERGGARGSSSNE